MGKGFEHVAFKITKITTILFINVQTTLYLWKQTFLPRVATPTVATGISHKALRGSQVFPHVALKLAPVFGVDPRGQPIK